jgi:diguanylate cyclase (GGDEF)-like protein
MDQLEERPQAGAETIQRLQALLEVGRRVREGADLDSVLHEIAVTVSDVLGLRTVVINLYRPQWDDFVVTTVTGSQDVRDNLLGCTYGWDAWEPILTERFEHRGAYRIYKGELDWDQHSGVRYVPKWQPVEGPDAWHPEDEVFVPFHHSDGHLLGIFCVGEPVSGRRPSDEQLDILVAVTRQAAVAVQAAQEAASAAQHQRGLERLLQISSQLTETLSADAILQAVCNGIRDALGFGKVVVELPEADTGRLRPHVAAGWDLADAAIHVPFTLDLLDRLVSPEFEVEGCYLLPLEEVEKRLELPETIYHSVMNGQGPYAWNRHWLLVPLYDRAGVPIGVVCADEPDDRLLPSRQRLQILRVFANQATTALDLAGQFETMRLLAERDALTPLFNRRTFMRRLEAELGRCTTARKPLALVYCDLDGLKQLNDGCGHEVGDQALVAFAELLLASVRRDDDAFRVGGDEFALLLPECTREIAVQVIERLSAAAAATTTEGGFPLAASFGIAVAEPEVRTTPADLLRQADQAMYCAKRSGSRLRVAA